VGEGITLFKLTIKILIFCPLESKFGIILSAVSMSALHGKTTSTYY
jgi:hypothetical protein